MVQSHVHKGLPVVPILSQANLSSHSYTFFKIHLTPIHIHIGFHRGFVPSGFSIEVHMLPHVLNAIPGTSFLIWSP